MSLGPARWLYDLPLRPVNFRMDVIGQNPVQAPRGPERYCSFTTITAEVVSFTLVAEDEVAIETLAVLSRRRIPTKLHMRGGHCGTLPAVIFGGKT